MFMDGMGWEDDNAVGQDGRDDIMAMRRSNVINSKLRKLYYAEILDGG